MKIVSVHVPKCGGTSLSEALERAFGKERIYYDYGDAPFNSAAAVNTDPEYFKKWGKADAFRFLDNKDAVHGHFHPHKYRALAPVLRITVLREPVERMISHYYFWKHLPRHHHPLHDYVLDHNLSLEAFAELEPVRHFYSGVFFKDVDMRTFHAVGAVEYMEDFLSALSRLLSRKISLEVHNVNPEKGYASLKNEILSDTGCLQRFQRLLRQDIDFYDHWAGHGCY